MYLGIKVVLAASYARIHESNLVNFGIPPLRFIDPADSDGIQQGDWLELPEIRAALEDGRPVLVRNVTKGSTFRVTHTLSPRQLAMLLAGGLTRFLRRKWGKARE
jgi:aconitate hydratase